MDIALTPDIYTPSVDNAGNYIDNTPNIIHGIYCPCGTRKDKAYETTSKFATHCKSIKHKNWLITLNQNKANYYVDLIEHKQIIENQRKIIQQLEQDIQRKTRTVDYLTDQLTYKTHPVIETNLLDIN